MTVAYIAYNNQQQSCFHFTQTIKTSKNSFGVSFTKITQTDRLLNSFKLCLKSDFLCNKTNHSFIYNRFSIQIYTAQSKTKLHWIIDHVPTYLHKITSFIQLLITSFLFLIPSKTSLAFSVFKILRWKETFHNDYDIFAYGYKLITVYSCMLCAACITTYFIN